MRKVAISLALASSLSFLLAVSGCSANGGQTAASAPLDADFSISFTPNTLSITQSGFVSVQATILWKSSATTPVSLTSTKYSQGLSIVTPTPIIIPQNTYTTTFTVLADATALPGAGTIVITASSTTSSLTHSYTLPVAIAASPVILPAAGRTSFLYAGATPAGILYDPVHAALFVSYPDLNQVWVIDRKTQNVLKKLSVQSPGDMDFNRESSQIVVGSQTSSALTFIDTISQAITRVVPLNPSQSGVTFFGQVMSIGITSPVFLAGGDVLFTGQAFLRWSPTTNRFSAPPSIPFGAKALYRTPDGSKVLITTSQDSLGIYDVATNSITAKKTVYAPVVAADPVNPRFALVDDTPGGFEFVDANLNTLATVPFYATVHNRPYAMQFSSDGTQLFAAITGTFTGFYALQSVDAVAYKMGLAAPITETPNYNNAEVPLAVDEKNLVYGKAASGVAIDDPLNYFVPSTPAIANAGPERLSTTNAAVGASVPVSFLYAYKPPPGIFFDGVPALAVATDSNSNITAVSPPASSAGPVNVLVVQSSRIFSMNPAAFSNGIQPVGLQPSTGPPAGGLTLHLLAYGADFPATALSATVGGQPATVLSVSTSYLPIVDVSVAAPPGTAGSTVDATLTTPNGTGTFAQAFTYDLRNTSTPFPSGAQPRRLLFDARRQQLYVASPNRIDVFSLRSNTFVTPIIPPTLNLQFSIANLDLTPDGKTLYVANTSDQSIAIIDPDNPSTARALPFFPNFYFPGYVTGPYALCTSSKGTVFVGTATLGITGAGNTVFEWDPVSNIATPRALGNSSLEIGGYFLMRSVDSTSAFISSPNGSAGPIAFWSAGKDVFSTLDTPGFVGPGAISADGSTISVPVFISYRPDPVSFLDSAMNTIGNTVLPTAVPSGALAGQFLNASGSLLYVPVTRGFNIYDVHSGRLIRQAGILEPSVSSSFKASTTDDTGNTLFLITASGLDVIQQSPPLSVRSVTPNLTSARAGTVITLRGSNFRAGATVTIAGVTVPATVSDSVTLTFVLPAPTTTLEFTVKNPNGETYTY